MSKQEKNCQIPTPPEYVEQLLDNIGYTKNVYGKKVLENSCGEGNILIEIVRRFIADGKWQGHLPVEIAGELENCIIGYEVEISKINVCIKRLNKLLVEEQIPEVNWSIKNADFLKADECVDFVIGNPPYVTYHDLTEKERKFVQENFSVCKKGRFDYCYAFIEASIKSLNSNGQMIYWVPYSIFRNKFAEQLRIYLQKYIVNIWDYRGISVFPDITCSTAVILCKKNVISDLIVYRDMSNNTEEQLNRNQLVFSKGNKWIFHEHTTGKRRFGDYFDIFNSVATLLNKAFLIEINEEREIYYRTGDQLIEKKVTYPAASTKSFRKKREKNVIEERIIFPYKLEDNIVSNYGEKEFKSTYPFAYQHLEKYKSSLEERKSDTKALWFEFGRSQALQKIWGTKLIIPMVITQKAKAYYAGSDTVPYAGYFIKVKKGSTLTLEDAKNIIESKAFYQYVQDVGTPTTNTSYRVSVYDIADYEF